ncbi:MAG: methyl-accepting chemotaxis protein, partial [Desulfobulbaceae bacterium]|nr:methyl-accepting chemotaxis protein [Desulfobulbaceae bacterium]
TAELIETTVADVKKGSTLVDGTNEAFQEVLAGSDKVAHLVGEIATASKEQTHGIEQINRAVNEMDKVTQQNAANAEESAASAQELHSLSVQMRGVAKQLDALICAAGTDEPQQELPVLGSKRLLP